jgi:hypothetical protein
MALVGPGPGQSRPAGRARPTALLTDFAAVSIPTGLAARVITVPMQIDLY